MTPRTRRCVTTCRVTRTGGQDVTNGARQTTAPIRRGPPGSMRRNVGSRPLDRQSAGVADAALLVLALQRHGLRGTSVIAMTFLHTVDVTYERHRRWGVARAHSRGRRVSERVQRCRGRTDSPARLPIMRVRARRSGRRIALRMSPPGRRRCKRQRNTVFRQHIRGGKRCSREE